MLIIDVAPATITEQIMAGMRILLKVLGTDLVCVIASYHVNAINAKAICKIASENGARMNVA